LVAILLFEKKGCLGDGKRNILQGMGLVLFGYKNT